MDIIESHPGNYVYDVCGDQAVENHLQVFTK